MAIQALKRRDVFGWRHVRPSSQGFLETIVSTRTVPNDSVDSLTQVC